MSVCIWREHRGRRAVAALAIDQPGGWTIRWRWGIGMAASVSMAAMPGWLRGARFDAVFIGGVALVAVAAGAMATVWPALFLPLLLLDLWLLGYHHVIATFTRLCFDGGSLRRHRFLVFGLPPIVLAAVAALVLGVGAWAVATIYFYWQWFHYVRQSWGIAQAYRRASRQPMPEPGWLLHAVVWLVPVWGILARSAQQPEAFLGMALWAVPVPPWLADAAGVAAAVVVAAWVAGRVQAAVAGRLPLAHSFYLASHLLVFWVGYVLIEDINTGWLVANIWHNAQYVLFVWLHHNRRFEGRREPAARFLSWLCQRRNMLLYFGFCLALSTAVYLAIQAGLGQLGLPIILAAAIVYQTLNFHHYIVDALIWRRPRPG
jgi:hypothetical protein